MTVRLDLVSLMFATVAQGCVVYDYPCGAKPDAFNGWDSGVENSDESGSFVDEEGGCGGPLIGDTSGPEDTGEQASAPLSFSLDPGSVNLAESTLADLLAIDSPSFDHTRITGVSFSGGVVLCALELQPEGATVSFAAPFDAEIGPVDVTVDLGERGQVTMNGLVTVSDSGGGVLRSPDADPCG